MIETFILVVISVLLTMFALKMLNDTNKISKNGIKAEGIVFDNEVGNQGYPTYPIIRFLTDKQEWITKASKIAVPPGIYKSGKTVGVIYDKLEPTNFVIDDKYTKVVPYVLIGVGTLFFVAGMVTLFVLP